MEAVTSPRSVVLLSVIDKSLTLLADACKSLESDNVSYILCPERGRKYNGVDRIGFCRRQLAKVCGGF